MKWVWFTTLSALFAMVLFACSNPIEPKGGDDDIALATYGPLSEDGMKTLVKGAMADCQEDPACKAAMENADGMDFPIEEESSSSAAADTASAKDGSSSSKKGPIIASSGSVKPDLSSSGGSGDSATGSSSSVASSGSKVVSSSSKGSSILNGACNATPTSVERGGSVTWKYVSLNSSLVIESYDWTFDEGSSITTSTDATPSVSYAAKGEYGASVTINKGKDTEKTVKCSNPVKVTGIKVTGCTCSTPSTSVVVSSSKPKDVTWTVSGCTGAEPFTYAWSGGASGTDASASMTISTVGSHAPAVTVTNSDGETMSPTCNSVSASEMPGAACKVGEHNYDANKTSMSVVPGQTFYFKPDNVTGVTGTMSMTLAGGGSSKTVSVSNGTNNSAVAVTAPAELGTYPYTLSVDGEEVCSANVTVDYPTLTTTCSWGTPVMPGAAVQFNMSKCSGWTDAMGDNATMVLTLDGKTTNLTVSRWNGYGGKVTVPEELGTYSYTVTYGGKEVCTGSVTTAYPNITSTSCALTEHNWDHTYYFTPGTSFSNWDAQVIGDKLNMTLYHDDEVVASDKSVSRYSNGDWYQYVPSTESGTHVFRLDFHGNTVCEVEYEVE